MNYSIRDINLATMECVLRSKDTLLEMAKENFQLKGSELEMKLKSAVGTREELEVINIELEIAKAIVEQPVSQEYIGLGLIEDVDATIDQLREVYATKDEATERLKLLGVARTILGLSREQAKEHIDRLFTRDIDIITEELQLTVMRIWAWKMYYSFLISLKKGIMKKIAKYNQSMKQQQAVNPGPQIEWLGSLKNLAELFIELKKKGFIKETDPDAIQRAFHVVGTKGAESKSLNQILKPADDKKTKETTYEHIYTPKYDKKFDGIKENSKK